MLCVGVLRLGEQLFGRTRFDNFPALHHATPVRKAPHNAQVMGDEQHRQAVIVLKLLQQFQNLRLNGNIKRGGGLIGDQQLGFVGQGHRNHDALPLPAGQLMREGAKPPFGIADAHLIEQFQNTRAGCRLGKAFVQRENFTDLLLNRMQRIERGHRLLEDHGDVIAANPAQVRFITVEQVLAFEPD